MRAENLDEGPASVGAWKRGDVALLKYEHYDDAMVAVYVSKCRFHGDADHWHTGYGTTAEGSFAEWIRPLVVLDPEDREQVQRLIWALRDFDMLDTAWDEGPARRRIADALRKFALPDAPDEPTDPATRVTDRRDNIWRLLADGDWVCTSGPDIGEYIEWSRLADGRGPLSIEVMAP